MSRSGRGRTWFFTMLFTGGKTHALLLHRVSWCSCCSFSCVTQQAVHLATTISFRSLMPFTPQQAKERAGTYTVLAPVVESEGHDRHSLLLPGSQMDLIQVVTSTD